MLVSNVNQRQEYSFEDLLEDGNISYGIVQPGAHIENNSVPIIRVQNIKNGVIYTDDVLKVDSSIENNYKRTRLNGGELLITVVGSIGECAIVPKTLKGWNVARAVSVAKFKKQFDTAFIKYLFKTEDVIFQMYGNTNDTVQPTLNLSALKKIKLTLPNLHEQKAIASVLSSLDDKIDLLHRQNKTLEAMAETLFRQWFIEEADESWEKGKIEDILTVKGGSTPRTDNTTFWNGEINWITPRDLSNNPHLFINETERKITEEGLKQISSGLLPVGTLLLSSRAPIGYLAISEIPIAINQGFIAIINDKEYSNEFIYLWLKSNMDYIIGSANGSTFLEISKSVFRNLEIAKPASDLRSDFDIIIKPMFNKISNNSKQIRTLEKLRDTLLPKLMSGEVRVKC